MLKIASLGLTAGCSVLLGNPFPSNLGSEAGGEGRNRGGRFQSGGNRTSRRKTNHHDGATGSKPFGLNKSARLQGTKA